MNQSTFPNSVPYREEPEPPGTSLIQNNANLPSMTLKLGPPRLQNAEYGNRPPTSSLTFFWLDSREAAQFLKVSVGMLRNMASNGQVPYYKLGRSNRYRRDELEALLLKHKRGLP